MRQTHTKQHLKRVASQLSGTVPHPPKKMGRPSRYNPDIHLPLVYECMAQGMSKAELCLELQIRPDTLWEWERRYKDFSDAIKIGLELARGWWERVGRLNLKNPGFNSTLWMMNMSNRFGYSRKVDSTATITGKVEETREVRVKIDTSPRSRAAVLGILAASGALPSGVADAINVKALPPAEDGEDGEDEA